MYTQVGDFRVSMGSPTVPLIRISRNAVFFKSQNLRKVGPFVYFFLQLHGLTQI